MRYRAVINLLLLALIVSICSTQILPEGSSALANFQNVNMSQLMSDLGLTEQDLKEMQNSIKSQDISNNQSTTNNNVAPFSSQAPSHPTSTTTSSLSSTDSSNNAQPTSADNIPTSSNGFFDLASIESMLGIKPLQTSALATTNNQSSSSSSSDQKDSQGQSSTDRSTGTFDLLDLSELEKQLGLVPSSLPTSSSNTQNTASQQQNKTQAASAVVNSTKQTQTTPSSTKPNTTFQSINSNTSKISKNSSGTTEQKTQQLMTDLQQLQLMLDQLKGGKTSNNQAQNISQAQSSNHTQNESSTKQNNNTPVNASHNAEGPGPLDPSLPAVIDISKANVIYSIIPGTNSTQNTTSPIASSKPAIPAENQIDLNKHDLVVIHSQYPDGYNPLIQQTSTGSKSTNSNNNSPQQTNNQNQETGQTASNTPQISSQPPRTQSTKSQATQTSSSSQQTQTHQNHNQVEQSTQQVSPSISSQTTQSVSTQSGPVSAPVDPTWKTPSVAQFIQASGVSRLDPAYQNQQFTSANNNANVINVQIPTQQAQNTVPTQSNLQKQSIVSAGIQPYQQRLTSKLAIYSLTTSYKTFSDSFILALNDPYLPTLMAFLSKNYGNYINNGKLTSGFKKYNSYDYSMTYQLLYETYFGLFNAYLDYTIETNKIVLKSLSTISFPMLAIDLENCHQPTSSKKQCEICDSNYRNFMGRCRKFDPSCLLYLTDQCGACRPPTKLERGVCI